MKEVFIVLINFNTQGLTIECLESLLKAKREDFNINTIIVDTYPKKRISINTDNYKDIRLKIILAENKGFSGGNNLGINYAIKNGADYIMILNNDTVVDPELIASLIKGFEFDEKIGIISPKIYFEKGYEFHKNKYSEGEKGRVIWYAGGVIDWKNVYPKHLGVDEVDDGQFEEVKETDFTTGCAFLSSAKIFSEMRGFDESYFLYFEDADFSLRVKKRGYKIMFWPKAVLWHKNAGSTGGSGSGLQDYYTTRNRMIFGIRFAPVRSKIALIKESLRLFRSGRQWQKKGISDFYLRRFGKGSYPVD